MTNPTLRAPLSEPQLNASKWRSLAFAGLDRQSSSSNSPRDASYAKTFAYIFENSVLSALVTAIFGPVHASRFRISSKDHNALVNMGKSAYCWNRDVKSTFLLQDFHVIVYGGNDIFDPSEMQLHENYSVNPKSPVVATIGLGLQSSLTHGSEQEQTAVWQEKVTVVTEEYFKHCL
jgi:hypothetical protein